jgi:hypothetical protein
MSGRTIMSLTCVFKSPRSLPSLAILISSRNFLFSSFIYLSTLLSNDLRWRELRSGNTDSIEDDCNCCNVKPLNLNSRTNQNHLSPVSVLLLNLTRSLCKSDKSQSCCKFPRSSFRLKFYDCFLTLNCLRSVYLACICFVY